MEGDEPRLLDYAPPPQRQWTGSVTEFVIAAVGVAILAVGLLCLFLLLLVLVYVFRSFSH